MEFECTALNISNTYHWYAITSAIQNQIITAIIDMAIFLNICFLEYFKEIEHEYTISKMKKHMSIIVL